jgi:5-methylcytosine-specific restriction protein A
MTTHDARLTTPAYRRLRLLVLDRDRWRCQVRGPRCTKVATEVDHVIERADGGAMYDPANMRASCKPCNGWRAANRTNALRRYRLGVPDYETRL